MPSAYLPHMIINPHFEFLISKSCLQGLTDRVIVAVYNIAVKAQALSSYA